MSASAQHVRVSPHVRVSQHVRVRPYAQQRLKKPRSPERGRFAWQRLELAFYYLVALILMNLGMHLRSSGGNGAAALSPQFP